MPIALRLPRIRLWALAGSVQAERLIAAGRIVLAGVGFVRTHMMTEGPMPVIAVASDLYLAYAVVLALMLLRAADVRRSAALAIHGLDLVFLALLLVQPSALSGLFLLSFLFAAVAGQMRWQWEGAVWTAVGGVGVFAVDGAVALLVPSAPDLETALWVGRGFTVAATAAFLTLLAALDRKEHDDLVRLAGWGRAPRPDLRTLLTEDLYRSAALLGVERLVVVFEDPDEPFLTIGDWRDAALMLGSESPEPYEPLVAAEVADRDFLCRGADGPAPTVLVAAEGSLRRWRGAPLHQALVRALGLRHVAAVRLRGVHAVGLLLACFERRMTADDLAGARLVAFEIAGSLDRFLHARATGERAAGEERSRLSRELHDGVLQSLSAAALRFRTAELAFTDDPANARALLRDGERLLSDGQRELRFWVEEQKPLFQSANGSALEFPERLRDLARNVEEVWGLHVTVEAARLEPEPSERVVHGLYRIAQEALVNSARHGRATAASLRVSGAAGGVRMELSDNGRGFRFTGQIEHETLNRDRLGPVVLKSRVAELGGRLTIRSEPSGATLEIEVPLGGAGG